MKNFSTAALFLLNAILAVNARAQSPQARSIIFHGHPYLAETMGRAVKVIPSIASVHLTPLGVDRSGPSNPLNPGCDSIYAEVQRRSYLFDDCADHPEKAICRAVVRGLRLLAEGRPDTDTEIEAEVGQTYALSAPALPADDQIELAKAVASALGVKTAAVTVSATGEGAAPHGDPIFTLAPGSAMEKVARLVPFAPQDLVQLHGGRIVTRNNLFACDLAAGRVQLTTTAKATLQSKDHIPNAVVDLAWNVHGALKAAADEIQAESSPLVRASLIGYHIGFMAASTAPVEDPLAGATALFQRLYDLSAEVPVLKEANSKEELRANLYPDQNFTASVEQTWSFQ